MNPSSTPIHATRSSPALKRRSASYRASRLPRPRPPSSAPPQPPATRDLPAAAITEVTRMILLTPSGVSCSQSRRQGPWDHGQKARFLGALSAGTWPCGVAARLTNLLSMGSCRSVFRGTASATPARWPAQVPTLVRCRAAAWPVEGATNASCSAAHLIGWSSGFCTSFVKRRCAEGSGQGGEQLLLCFV